LGTLGGYLTASPIVANNIASIGPLPTPIGLTQIGGGNGAGAFGTGTAFNAGNAATFALSDSGPGGGSASYIIESAIASYTNVGNAVAAGTLYGSYIAIGGAVPLIGNADVASLRVHYTDTAGVFGAVGTDAPQEVLAISRNGGGVTIDNYNIVLLGGVGGGNAGLILDNGVTGSFRALAVDAVPLPAVIPIGDMITATWTLTAYTDPASIDIIDFTPDLLNLTGPLPSLTLVDAATPEPGVMVLTLIGLITICLYRRYRVA
jgi:hypothetical protein